MAKRTNTAQWMPNQNRWQIKVQKDGERKTFTSSKLGRTGQREANAKADAWLDDGIASGGEKINAICDSYLEDIKSRTSMSNWRPEESRINNWVRPYIGNLKVSSLNEQHLQNIINAAYKDGKSKKFLSNIRATLFSLCKFMRKIKVSTFNPEDVIIPKSAVTGERKILQPQDIEVLFTSDETIIKGKVCRDEFINAYRLQVVTGLRPGELFGLRRSDIRNGFMYITRSINQYNEVTAGKNDNARREIALHIFSQSILDDQLSSHNDDKIFPQISTSGYWLRFKRYCEHNGIQAVTPYELRHTFVSIVQDLSEGELKTVIGHSKNMDTYGVYAHEVKGKNLQTADKIGDIFSKMLVPSKG